MIQDENSSPRTPRTFTFENAAFAFKSQQTPKTPLSPLSPNLRHHAPTPSSIEVSKKAFKVLMNGTSPSRYSPTRTPASRVNRDTVVISKKAFKVLMGSTDIHTTAPTPNKEEPSSKSSSTPSFLRNAVKLFSPAKSKPKPTEQTNEVTADEANKKLKKSKSWKNSFKDLLRKTVTPLKKHKTSKLNKHGSDLKKIKMENAVTMAIVTGEQNLVSAFQRSAGALIPTLNLSQLPKQDYEDETPPSSTRSSAGATATSRSLSFEEDSVNSMSDEEEEDEFSHFSNKTLFDKQVKTPRGLPGSHDDAGSIFSSLVSPSRKSVAGTSFSSSLPSFGSGSGSSFSNTLPSPRINVSFQQTLTSDFFRPFFEKFCETERSSENIQFWKEVQHTYKTWKNKRQRTPHARKLYMMYVDASAPHALNIDSKIIRGIKARIDNPEDDLNGLFDELLKITELNMNDTFARFLNSQLYKTMVHESGLSVYASSFDRQYSGSRGFQL